MWYGLRSAFKRPRLASGELYIPGRAARGTSVRLFNVVLGLLLSAMASGCRQGPPQVAPAEPLVVPVSHPVARDVTDYVEFTGRTDAVEALNVVPRVTGYLVSMPFREGSEVKKGDLLFEIDARPYQAQLDQAEGQVRLYMAQLDLARTTLARDTEISKTPGAVSAQQLDQDRAAVAEAEARVKAYQASTEVYKLNLSFTRVTSPIDGQISRSYLTTGNLVNQDQTLLTTIVSLDPIYAFFDMDEPTLLRVRRAVNEGRITLPENGVIPVYLGVQGEEGLPHEGTLNFVNNQVNATTGSIQVRAVFANPRPPGTDARPRPVMAVSALGLLGSPGGNGALLAASTLLPRRNGTRLLSPGMFVRIRLPLGQPHGALLVIDRAITSDQGLKYVYVVDAQNKIQSRRITTGALQMDGLRVVADGLRPDDWVVVGSLQQVRPRMEVRMEPAAMPSPDRSVIGGQTSSGDQSHESDKTRPPAKGPGRGRGEAKDKSGGQSQAAPVGEAGSASATGRSEAGPRAVFPGF